MVLYPQYFAFFLALSGILAIFVGSVNALYQIKFKRFLAFSGIANLGYILLGLSALSTIGSLSMVFYLMIYILNLTSLMYMMLTVRDDTTIKNVIEFMVIKHNNYPLIILLALNFLSLAGIPPLLGFIPKLFLFVALGDLGLSFGIVYTLFMSILMAISYLRIVRFLIIDEK